MTAPEPEAIARTWVTEIWCPPADSGVHALHSQMPEPEPLPEPEPEAQPVTSISAEYDGNYLAPEQIGLLHAGLQADLAELTAMDAEPEPEAGL
jgi:hypothetical protein